MQEARGVGLREVGFEGGSVQWLMIVEVVFEASFMVTRGVLMRGVSSRNVCTSQL